jgi:hypothetical protein
MRVAGDQPRRAPRVLLRGDHVGEGDGAELGDAEPSGEAGPVGFGELHRAEHPPDFLSPPAARLRPVPEVHRARGTAHRSTPQGSAPKSQKAELEQRL